MQRRIVRLLVLLAMAGTAQATRAADAPRPHIIFMMADDLGWGDVGFHGSSIRTPNIDRLAERGTELTQFYVQPVCSPTRASLMTGRYPMRYGLQCGVVRPWAEHALPLDERTLASALQEAGYKTAVVGKWHLGHMAPEYLPTARGFDLQYGHYNGALDYFTHERDGGHDWHRNDEPNYDKGYTTDLLGQAAAEIIAEHDAAQPLFLYVPFNAPHGPYQAKKADIARYADIQAKDRRLYAAMVTSMDQAVGQIMAALEQSTLAAENTLVIFTSDNGGVLRVGSNGELRAGKTTLYEGGVRVPTVAVWAGVLKAGTKVDGPLHMVDMFPTLLGLAGGSVAGSQPLDGRDAWPTIAQGRPSPHANSYILHNVTPFHGAIRMGQWKLVHNGHVNANDTKVPEQQTWDLFNLRDDPSERRDVKAEHPEQFERLKQQLAQLAAEAAPANIPPNSPPADFHVPEIWGHFPEASN